MFSGILNEIIEIWRMTTTKNRVGEEEQIVQKYKTTRAGVSNNTTSRQVINYEIQYPYTKYFITRIYVDVQEDDYIKYKGKFYRILSIEENRELQNKRIDVEIANGIYFEDTSYSYSYTGQINNG